MFLKKTLKRPRARSWEKKNKVNSFYVNAKEKQNGEKRRSADGAAKPARDYL